MSDSDNNKYLRDSVTFNKLPQFLTTFAASVGAIGIGAVEGWSSPVVPQLTLEDSGDIGKNRASSGALVGAALGGIPAAILIEVIGRKSTIILLSVPFIGGWMVITGSTATPFLLAGRLITGFCAGAYSVVIPVYISEISNDSTQSFLTSVFQVMITVGNLLAYSFGCAVPWRTLSFVCSLVPMFGMAAMLFAPSSPPFLYRKGRVGDAEESLMTLKGVNTSLEVGGDLKKLALSPRITKMTWKNILKPCVWKPMILSIGLMTFQELTGIEAIVMHTVDIFEDGTTRLDPYISTLVIGIFQLFFTILSAIFVDKAGRRILLFVSSIIMALSLSFLASYFYARNNSENMYDFSWIPLAALCTFIIGFSVGFGPIPWVTLGELLPGEVIGLCSAAAMSINWLCAYGIVSGYKTIASELGAEWCFGFFAISCFLSLFYVYFLLPETKGKCSEEIKQLFKNENDQRSYVAEIRSCNISEPKIRNPLGITFKE